VKLNPSLYVKATGAWVLGGSLMKKALSWMGQIGALEKVVEVSSGNEAAFGFYRRYGFLPRKTVLKQAREDYRNL
jgi:ribosomal protein S18 acetylase RimI-like enzyme